MSVDSFKSMWMIFYSEIAGCTKIKPWYTKPMDTPIDAKLAENIHDYLDEIRDLIDTCEARPKFPIQAIQARSLILQELPKIIEAVEMLSQSLVKTLKTHPDAQAKLEGTRCLERTNYILTEELPRAKKDLVSE